MMRRKYRFILLLALTILLFASCRESSGVPSTAAPEATVRPSTVPVGPVRRPAVAGTFYPAEAEALGEAVDGYMEGLGPTEGRPIALIVPHAGYVYSGPVAAYAYAELIGQQYNAVILIGPNHRVQGLTGIVVYASGAWETPLGSVPVDVELAQAILQANPNFVDDPSLHAREHSLEVQLPFLQRVLPDTPIVPIMIGWPDLESTRALADALLQVLPGRDVLLVISSDFSHYPTYEDAVEVDRAILAAIETMDVDVFRRAIAEQMSRGVPNLATTCCGEGPIAVLLEVAPQLGADRVTVLHYANSGDVPIGDRNQVVGYGAVKLWKR